MIKLPEWTVYIKSSYSNEISPIDCDYMYTKAAAIARIIYLSKSKNIGVGTLRTIFGKKNRRGVQPPISARASGKIIRVILQQLEKISYIEKFFDEGKHSIGRAITKEGIKNLDKIASEIMKERK